jgi:uncharacterized Zn-binding protein involved in type VI secretion
MPAVQRVGDKNSDGAAIQQGDSSVLINGLAVAVNGNPVAGKIQTTNSQTLVLVNGIPVIVTGNKDTNKKVRVGGSPDVTIG